MLGRKVNPPRKILQIQFYCNKLGAGSTFMYMHFPALWILHERVKISCAMAWQIILCNKCLMRMN
nr:MAG TPA: hypothetical protein [Caudoviricetes sp.]